MEPGREGWNEPTGPAEPTGPGPVVQTLGAALHWRGPWTGPPPRLPCRDRTVGLVQRASRADGSVPPAEIRHPWVGRRPAWVMPSNKRRHATTQDGAPVNSSLRLHRGPRTENEDRKTGRSVGGGYGPARGGVSTITLRK
ncbi:hypothetical protein D1J63_13145 [Streptomyces sp. KPB2]|nr:hypothetical protein D1J63_13145 [Streptomyces sp. KPB2]